MSNLEAPAKVKVKRGGINQARRVMPFTPGHPLRKPQWEIMAQELARGTSVLESYRIAGYSMRKGAQQYSSVLANRAEIFARVQALRAQNERMAANYAPDFAALDVVNEFRETKMLSKEWVTEMLIKNAQDAHREGQFNASTGALKMLALTLGMIGKQRGDKDDARPPVLEENTISPDQMNAFLLKLGVETV